MTQLDWSPDGRFIAFTFWQQRGLNDREAGLETDQIYVVDTIERGACRLTHDDYVNYVHPKWIAPQ